MGRRKREMGISTLTRKHYVLQMIPLFTNGYINLLTERTTSEFSRTVIANYEVCCYFSTKMVCLISKISPAILRLANVISLLTLSS